MDVIAILQAVGQYGLPMVISGFVIYGVVRFVGWVRGHVDRKIAKDEERREKQEARADLQTVIFERSTESMEQVAVSTKEIASLVKPLVSTVERIDRTQGEHGSALAKVLEHLFGEEKRD